LGPDLKAPKMRHVSLLSGCHKVLGPVNQPAAT
jgi:hypothetical protein